ncbi:MAG: hypothetical protein MAG795_00689 [Candidatus Woesearchaeota archaeon]|nr:hypothetical protein [Candidatus Woesearchaeota archaeon]
MKKLQTIMEDIQKSGTEDTESNDNLTLFRRIKEFFGLDAESNIDRFIDMRFIHKRSIEISPKYLQRLQQDRGYRKIVKQYLIRFPGYEHVDDCLHYAAETLECIEDFGGIYQDAVKMLKSVQKFIFYIKPSPYRAYKALFSDIAKRCNSRNDYFGFINYANIMYKKKRKKLNYRDYHLLSLRSFNLFEDFDKYEYG